MPLLDEDSIEDCTDKNDSESQVSLPRDMPANENLNEDWIDMNEPGVSPSRDVLADENSDEDSNESCCGTLDDSSLSSGSDHSNNELVDSPTEIEG